MPLMMMLMNACVAAAGEWKSCLGTDDVFFVFVLLMMLLFIYFVISISALQWNRGG
jgi:hypothetical protein